VIFMRLLCYGDSNTYGYDPRSFLGDRYPSDIRWTDQLAKATGWEVVNAGQNGRTIPGPSAAKRLSTVYGPADTLTVMLGTNDLLQGGSPQEATGRMEAFLTPLLSVYPSILLISPPPMQPGTWVTEDRLLTDSAALVQYYEALAQRFGVQFANAGAWGVELLFDGVHFSESGHHAFFTGLLAALRAG
jgi:lysophospholipase L1-like esterase